MKSSISTELSIFIKSPFRLEHTTSLVLSFVLSQLVAFYIAPKMVVSSYSGSSAAAMSRIAPCCLMLISSIRRSLHAVIYIHELSETALCAARASPRRRVRSRARKTRLQNKAPRSPRRSYPSRGIDLRPEHVVGRPAPRPPGPFRKNLCFRGPRANAVSYTHLTLPTSDLV